MEGQLNSALQYLNDNGCGAILPLQTDNIIKQLHDKHPKVQPVKLGSLLFGPVEEAAYNEITGEMIREAAPRNKGAGGPSNVDANGCQSSLLASHSRSLALICVMLLQL